MGGFDMICFGFFYILYIIVSLILLLNLLVAMLSNTFEMVRQDSTLKCRTSFAQLLLKYEMVANSLGMATHAGEKVGDKYVFNFRSVEGSGSGGSDPFDCRRRE